MSEKKAAIKRDVLLNGRQCAESIGISYNAFSKWGIPNTTGENGREKLYSLKDVLAYDRARHAKKHEAEVDRLKDRIAELEGGADSDTRSYEKVKYDQEVARGRLLEEQAEGQRMKNEMMRHEIAPFAFITFALGKTANAIAGVMDAMPVELMRKLNLKPHDVEKVKAVTAAASDNIASLGDEDWVEARFDEFLAETDQ